LNICVFGLWHLGSVTSASLASVGHKVIGLDTNSTVIDNLNNAIPPIFEPGLESLIQSGIVSNNLSFTVSYESALCNIDILWVTIDTPVDDNDVADVEFVINKIKFLFNYLNSNVLILVSSQLPVGSISILEKFAIENYSDKNFSFAYLPENLRLGKSLDVFLNPDRIVIGCRDVASRTIIENTLLPISDKLVWMSVESAEMTKHAINSFLAVSVTFANELASICEYVGADASEVSLGLKSDKRIGQQAYLSAGSPFAGGTLARDISFLNKQSSLLNLKNPLISSIGKSNNYHKDWYKRTLINQVSNFNDLTVAIWGLTYKPGTDTLRRSLSVEFCDWLLTKSVKLKVFDPAVKIMPVHWTFNVFNCNSPLDTLINADVLFIGTEWPQFKDSININALNSINNLIIIDPNRFLKDHITNNFIKHIYVGSPKSFIYTHE
jgi:UDPglucose 6-dehydrogenase